MFDVLAMDGESNAIMKEILSRAAKGLPIDQPPLRDPETLEILHLEPGVQPARDDAPHTEGRDLI